MAKRERRALEISAKLEETITKELAAIRKQVEKTGKATKKANEDSSKSFKLLAGAVAAVGAAMVALRGVNFLRDIAEQTDRVGKLAIATGSTSEQVSELAFAFELAGGSSEQFGAVLSSLLSSQRGAVEGSKAQVEAFAKFGLNIRDLRRLNPAQLLEALSDGVGNIADATDKTLTLSTLFPEQWRNVLNLIEGGGDQFREQLRIARQSGATVTKEQAQAAAQLNDAMARAQSAIASVGRELLVTFGPTIIDALDTFANTLLANQEAVRAIGNAILKLLNATLTGALQTISGLLQILEAAGISEATVGTAEQIARAKEKEAQAAQAVEEAFARIVTLQEQGREITEKQRDDFSQLQRDALDAFEKVQRLAQAPSVAIEKLLLDLERATGVQAQSLGENVGSNIFSTLREGLRTAAGQLDADAKDTGRQIGETTGAAAAVSFAMALAGRVAEEFRKRKDELEAPFLNLDWEEIKQGYDDGLQGLTQKLDNFSNTVGKSLASGVEQVTQALSNAFASIITGTKSSKEAFKEFGIATLQIIARVLAQLLALQVVKTVVGLAKGGVLPAVSDDDAPLPVRGYARGGVARSPQLAVFGEGRQAEAFVPLPDNRTIPVTINGGGYGGGQSQVNLNVYAWDSKDAARGLIENRSVLQQIFTSQADNLVGMRQTIQRATR